MNGSAHFAFIAAAQGDTAYGQVLDAGTGTRSLRWLASLDTDAITAVTGAAPMAARVKRAIGERQRPQDRILVGNWADAEFLAGERFDTVLADHLLGAIEGHAPFYQSSLFTRLRPLTRRRLYVTGMEPYVVARPRDEAGALIWEIGRYRDACLLLSGQRSYREYPLDWVLAELRRSGFQPISARKFPVAYRATFVNSQIDLARPRLKRLADRALGQSLIDHGEALRSRSLAHIESHGAINHGFHYAVAADPT